MGSGSAMGIEEPRGQVLSAKTRIETFALIAVIGALAVSIGWLILGYLLPGLIAGIIAIAIVGAMRSRFLTFLGWQHSQLVVSPWPVPLGADFGVAYRRKPRRGVGALAGEMRIELKCEEWAKYRRGTDTVTVRETALLDVYAFPIAMSEAGLAGGASMPIPLTAGGPTMNLPNNGLTWTLKVDIEAHHGIPNDSATFTFIVDSIVGVDR